MGQDDGYSPGERARQWIRMAYRFIECNWLHVIQNAIAIVGWVTVLILVFSRVEGPRWAYHLLLFGGITAYSLTQESFELLDHERTRR